MPLYSWCCIACDQTNPGPERSCDRCGCPAEATSWQIENARDTWRRHSGLPPLAVFDRAALLAQVPWLPIAAVLLLCLGVLLLIVDMEPSSIACGGLMIALAALCVSSYRPPTRPAGP